MTVYFPNDAMTPLGANITDTTGTSITVDAGTTYGTAPGDFPTTGDFYVRIGNEYMKVTNVAHPTWTVVRGVENSTKSTHTASTSTIVGILTGESIASIPAYAPASHGDAFHSGNVLPVSDQTLQGDLNADSADIRSIGNTSRMALVSGKTLRTEDVLGATPSGGSNGDIKVGSSAIWWKSNGAWISSASGGGGGGGGFARSADYFMTWDGATASAVNGRNGNTDYTDSSGTGYHTVWNQAITDLANRTGGVGGYMQLVNLQASNTAIPVYGTLQTCDGLTLRGTGYGKRGLSGHPDTGSVVLQAQSSFTNDSRLAPIDGNVLINCTAPITPATISSASWAANVVTINTSGAHGLTNNDYVYITGVTPSGYNTSGDNSAVQITVTSSTQFTFGLNSNPGAYTSGGTVYRLGTREDVSIESLAAYGNNVVDVVVLAVGTGVGAGCRLTSSHFRGGRYNTVQIGSRAIAGGSGDIFITFTKVSHNDTPGTENALVALYAGDCMILYNNFAAPGGQAFGLYISTSGVPVFVGWTHIGGGGSSQARVKVVGGQNIRLESNYFDNAKDTTHGAVWVRPGGNAVIQCTIRNNFFNMNAAAPLVVFDGTSSTNATHSSVRGNQTNGNSASPCPAIVQFTSWAANKPVHITDNVVQHVAALTAGDPANMQGERRGNILSGNGVNGDMSEERGILTGVGTSTTWTFTHHLYGTPAHVQVTPLNAAAAGSNWYVSALGTGTITITSASATAPQWDVALWAT